MDQEIRPVLQRIRQQLTLFLKDGETEAIEALRKEFNPRQHELIAAHVTLCREDEIRNWEQVRSNLNKLSQISINLVFSKCLRFSEGKGVYLEHDGETGGFDQLRAQVLEGTSHSIRKHEPHITLMHPRNSICTDETFAQFQELTLPLSFSFTETCLIEQVGAGPWKVLETFSAP